jgi:hypothetical protein
MKCKMAETQNNLDITNGPILGIDLFDTAGDGQVLFLVACHLCIDMVSWRVVLQDLEEYLQNGSITSEPPSSFQEWCGITRPKETSREQPQLITDVPNVAYWGAEDLTNTYGQARTKSFILDSQTTRFVLGQLHEALHTEPIDLLLAVAFRSFSQTFTDRSLPVIYTEGHGRQSVTDPSVDVSGTVGWFTTLKAIQLASHSGMLPLRLY